MCKFCKYIISAVITFIIFYFKMVYLTLLNFIYYYYYYYNGGIYIYNYYILLYILLFAFCLKSCRILWLFINWIYENENMNLLL